MKFLLKVTDSSRLEVDVLILYCWEDGLSEISGVKPELLKIVKESAAKEQFEGHEDQSLILSTKGIISAYKLLLIGLGKKEDFDIYRLYKSVALSVKKARETKPAKLAIVPLDLWFKNFGATDTMKATVESVALSSYMFLRYKSEEEKKKIRFIDELIISISAVRISAAEEGLHTGLITSEAVNFARDLINEPAEVTSPSYLAKIAEEIAQSSKGAVKVKIMEREEVAKMGMGAFLGVAQGSDKPPKFIHLSYYPANPKKKVVLIGKGITFDTGGLSLKNPEFMETMKSDMSGAAAILAIFKALSALRSNIYVIGLIAACENMPSGKALKPGDILKAMNGKTIEVLNTDAEGRLTLADVISFANIREKPDEIIDLATLTGACIVALGQEIAGLWGNNEKLITEIEKSSKLTGEMVWRMPLFKEYRELLKSHIADIKNIQTGRFGGAIAAAIFLSEFIGNTPWVHLDIAGPAYAEKDTPLSPYGGTGFGVRMLLNFLSNK